MAVNIWAWKVVTSNERMGFRRTLDVEAMNWKDAAAEAFAELVRRGYVADAFTIVGLERRSIVRQVRA